MKLLVLAGLLTVCTASALFRGKNIAVKDDGTILITGENGKRVIIKRPTGVTRPKNMEIFVAGPNIPTKRIVVSDQVVTNQDDINLLQDYEDSNTYSSESSFDEELRLQRKPSKKDVISQTDILVEILKEFQGTVDDTSYGKLLKRIQKSVKKGEISPTISSLLEGLDSNQVLIDAALGLGERIVQGAITTRGQIEQVFPEVEDQDTVFNTIRKQQQLVQPLVQRLGLQDYGQQPIEQQFYSQQYAQQNRQQYVPQYVQSNYPLYGQQYDQQYGPNGQLTGQQYSIYQKLPGLLCYSSFLPAGVQNVQDQIQGFQRVPVNVVVNQYRPLTSTGIQGRLDLEDIQQQVQGVQRLPVTERLSKYRPLTSTGVQGRLDLEDTQQQVQDVQRLPVTEGWGQYRPVTSAGVQGRLGLQGIQNLVRLNPYQTQFDLNKNGLGRQQYLDSTPYVNPLLSYGQRVGVNSLRGQLDQEILRNLYNDILYQNLPQTRRIITREDPISTGYATVQDN